MMTEALFDDFETFLNNNPSPTGLDPFLTNESTFYTSDSSPFTPSSDPSNNPEVNFDIEMFQTFLDELTASDSSALLENQWQPDESESGKREIGTDPMENYQPAPLETKQIVTTPIQLANYSWGNAPIIIIRPNNSDSNMKSNQSAIIFSTPTAIQQNSQKRIENVSNYEATITENLGEIPELFTPSPSNDSTDETRSSSPDINTNSHSNSLVTNLLTLPKHGPLVLTDEELKLIKQEGYPIPTKLPLGRTEEKMLKRIQRKIKNKISAQESRRKRKEYVDALEKKIEKCMSENNTLKELLANMEKNQKSLAEERDSLKSMIGKAANAPSSALMVFALFFAVLIGAWSPMQNKYALEDHSLSTNLAFVPSNNHASFLSNGKSFGEQDGKANSNVMTDSYKSRVLLSMDEHEHHHHHHGPHLPSAHKIKSIQQSESAAPGYTYARTIEKYTNKRTRVADTSDTTEFHPIKRQATTHPQEKIVIIEETSDDSTTSSNESRPVKIIRVERTKPAMVNDTLKLSTRSTNE